MIGIPTITGAKVWHRRKHGARAAAVLLAATALAACGSAGSSSGTTTTSGGASNTAVSSGVAAATAALQPYMSEPTKINITTPLKSKPPTNKTVVFLGTSDPSNVLVQQMVQKLCGILHWNYSLVTYDPANPGTFTAAISTALQKHPDFLTESGMPLTSAQISMVQSSGAKWVLNSVYPSTITGPILGITDTGVQDSLMGKIVADYFVSDSKGQGHAIIEHVPAYPILDAFVSGFQNEVKATCPKCTTMVENVTIPQLVAGQVPSVMVAAVRSNPSANYLVFDDGPFADGVPAALAGAGLAGKVKIIGEAADTTAIAALKAGTEAAWTGFDPSYQGYLTVDMMLRSVEGMSIPVADEAVQPTQLLTHSNVGSITQWSAPSDALAQFEALWKL